MFAWCTLYISSFLVFMLCVLGFLGNIWLSFLFFIHFLAKSKQRFFLLVSKSSNPIIAKLCLYPLYFSLSIILMADFWTLHKPVSAKTKQRRQKILLQWRRSTKFKEEDIRIQGEDYRDTRKSGVYRSCDSTTTTTKEGGHGGLSSWYTTRRQTLVRS